MPFSRPSRDEEWAPAPPSFFSRLSLSSVNGEAILPPPVDSVNTDIFKPPSRTSPADEPVMSRDQEPLWSSSQEKSSLPPLPSGPPSRSEPAQPVSAPLMASHASTEPDDGPRDVKTESPRQSTGGARLPKVAAARSSSKERTGLSSLLFKNSQQNTGDTAGGMERPRDKVQPTSLGRADDAAGVGAVKDGGGVGAMRADFAEVKDMNPMRKAWMPAPDSSFLGSSASRADGPVVVHDGYGHKVPIDRIKERAFPVQLDSTGSFQWDQGDVLETNRVSLPDTNWIVARHPAECQRLTWLYYKRSPWLPKGLIHLGKETVPLVGDGPVAIQDGSNNEVTIKRGQDRIFMVHLDKQRSFSWRCESLEQRISAPSSDVTWIHAEYPQEGQEVVWTFYGTPSPIARRPSKDPGSAQISRERRGSGGSAGSSPGAGLPNRLSKEKELTVDTSFKDGQWCHCTCSDFPLCSIHCPATFAVIVIICVLTLVGVLWPGIDVDTDFDSFLEADSRANEVRMAFVDALQDRGASRRLASHPGSRSLLSVGDPSHGYAGLDPTVLHKIMKLEVMYRKKDGGNVLTQLSSISEFESHIRELPGWERMCKQIGNIALSPLCEPGASLVNFMWPVKEDTGFQFHSEAWVGYNFTGHGQEELPLEAALHLTRRFNMVPAFFPKDYTGGTYSAELRSLFEFDLMVSRVDDTMAYRKKQLRWVATEYDRFVSEELFPAMMEKAEELAEEESNPLEVYWRGQSLDSHEVWETLKKDCLLALGSFIFIFLYLTFHTRSPLISATALFLVIISIPTAFVTSARLSGGNRVTGASFLSLFLLVGLGADVVLVFVSFWDLSRDVHHDHEYPQRIKFTYRTAGLACLATSATTAGSFFANLASVLKPLREFGFFMGLCIMGAYSFILVGLPPVLIVNEKLTNYVKEKVGIGDSQELPLNNSPHSDASAGGTVRIRNSDNHFAKFVVFYYDVILIPWKRVIIACFLFFPIIMLIWTGTAMEVDGEMPEMFPEGHNQNAGKKLSSKFPTIKETWVNVHAEVCNLDRVTPPRVPDFGGPSCALNWCQIGIGPHVELPILGETKPNGQSSCICMPTKEPISYPRCQEVRRDDQHKPVHEASVIPDIRLVGPAYIPESFWTSAAWEAHIKAAVQKDYGTDLKFASLHIEPYSSYNFSMMVQEHWESGTVMVNSYIRAAFSQLVISKESLEEKWELNQVCGPSEVCYCGTPACKFRDEPLIGVLPNDAHGTRLEIPGDTAGEERRLTDLQAADGTAPFDQDGKHPMARVARLFHRDVSGRRLQGLGDTVDVSLVWGLEVVGGVKLLGTVNKEEMWQYDSSFRPALPSSQRHLYKSCKMRDDPDLMIESHICWIQEFRDFLVGRGELFPARTSRFDSLLQKYVATGLLSNGNTISDFMWFDGGYRLKACYMVYYVAMSIEKTPSHRALKFKQVWDKKVKEFNEEAPDDAAGAWHTSRLWIRAEAEKAIIDSTVATLMVSIGCGFIGAIVFTHLNVLLSLLVVMSVGGVTACLAFFMSVIMGWATGAVEVLGLIVFVGYSITYSLHIAHKYCEHMKRTEGRFFPSERREFAVKHALDQMTSAVLGSALTTLGSSFFLFFCTMGIFVKLATVLFAVTVFAEVFALVGLPSALLVFGPRGAYGCFGLCGDSGISAYGSEEPDDGARADTEEPAHLDDSATPKSIDSKSEVFISAATHFTPAPSPALSAATASQRFNVGMTSEPPMPLLTPEANFMPSRPRYTTPSSVGSANAHGADVQRTTSGNFAGGPRGHVSVNTTATAPPKFSIKSGKSSGSEPGTPRMVSHRVE